MVKNATDGQKTPCVIMRPDAASAGVRDVTVAVHRCVTSPSDDLGRCYICMRRRDISLCMRHYCVYTSGLSRRPLSPLSITIVWTLYWLALLHASTVFYSLGQVAFNRRMSQKLDSPVKKISRLDELLRPIKTVIASRRSWFRHAITTCRQSRTACRMVLLIVRV